MQIFQLVMSDVTVKGSDIQSNVGKFFPVQRRARDPSDVAGASILASLSSLRSDISRRKHEDPANSAVPDSTDMELGCAEGTSAPNISEKADESGAVAKSLPHDSNNQDSGVEAGNVNTSGLNHLIRPSLRVFTHLNSCKLKLSKSMYKQALEEINGWARDSQSASTSGVSLRSAVVKQEIQAEILDGRNLEVSFDNFPYYLR